MHAYYVKVAEIASVHDITYARSRQCVAEEYILSRTYAASQWLEAGRAEASVVMTDI